MSAMSKAGIAAMLLGALICCRRGPLLLAPAATLRLLGEVVKTEARTRMFGTFAVLVSLLMIWSGIDENSGLASFMFIFGVLILVITIPALVLFPRFYMSVVDSMLPADSDTNLFGWRIFGLVNVIIGVGLFRIGMVAL